MSVIGLVGPTCSGKSTLSKILAKDNNYKIVILEKGQDYAKIGHDIFNQWQIPTVVTPISNKEQIKVLKKRTYFQLIYVDAPVHDRYLRYLNKYNQSIEFDEFIQIDDKNRCAQESIQMMQKCKVKLYNKFTLLSELEQHCHDNIKNIIRPFRPDQDIYYMKIAYALKSRSNCMKKSVGAVLVDKYQRILSTSYNGTPKVMKNCNEGGCQVCKESESLDLILYKCMCIHAEEGCILEQGMGKTRGSTLYTTLFPCVWCCKALVQAGVKQIVYDEMSNSELAVEFIGDLIAYRQVSIKDYIY